MTTKKIAVLAGDGIGPEITAEAVKALRAVGEKYGHEFEFEEAAFGGAGYDRCGHPFPKETQEVCDGADAILKGPVGAPKYDSLSDPALRPERGGVLALRKKYDTFATFRPVRLPASLAAFSPLKQSIVGNGIDIMMVRELVGGIYFGKKERGTNSAGEKCASDLMEYSEPQVERIARVALSQARARKSKLYNIHKANVLECSVFWNAIVDRVAKEEFPDVQVAHMLVDNAAYQLVANPCQFSVMLLENMMGDILTDQAGGVIGSLGLMPSACMGPKKSYFEPAHGSAPGKAGKNEANPYSMIGSAAMMLEMAFGMKQEAGEVWRSIFGVLESGFRTVDLKDDATPDGKVLSTTQFGDMVAKAIRTGTA